MKITIRNYFFAAYIFGALSFCLNSFSQVSEKTVIKGRVTDALTGYPIPFASVFLKGTTIGTLTDNNGIYRIESNLAADTISCSFIGYTKESRGIRIGVEQTIDLQMALTSINLDEVIIKAKKKDYSNKNNPAVALIEEVVEKKDENRPEAFNYLEYKTYERGIRILSQASEICSTWDR